MIIDEEQFFIAFISITLIWASTKKSNYSQIDDYKANISVTYFRVQKIELSRIWSSKIIPPSERVSLKWLLWLKCHGISFIFNHINFKLYYYSFYNSTVWNLYKWKCTVSNIFLPCCFVIIIFKILWFFTLFWETLFSMWNNYQDCLGFSFMCH